MKKNLTSSKRKGMRPVTHWYLPLIAGVLCIACGVFIFVYPLESYVLLAISLGIVMIVTGVAETVMAVSSRNWFFTRPWNIVGATINILLGILLCANPAITLVMLPLFVGIWILVRSLMLFGLSRDFSNMELTGGGWMFALALLLLVTSLMILLRPFAIGIPMIVILSGIGFIISGLSLTYIALQAKKIHKLVEKYMPSEIEVEEF